MKILPTPQSAADSGLGPARLLIASAIALALTACGGGGGGAGGIALAPTTTTTSTQATPEGTGSVPEPSAPATKKTPVATLPAGVSPSLGTADCAVLQGATPTAPSLADADVRAISDILGAVDAPHSYAEFVRTPGVLTWWVRSTGTAVDLTALGMAVHETNHAIDNLLTDQCNVGGFARYYADGQVHRIDTRYGDTSNRSIIASTYPAALKTSRALRYDLYVTGTAANNGNDFASLLEEFNAYAGAAKLELKVRSTPGYDYLYSDKVLSDEDLGGMVDFMLFMQHYLLSARLNHATTYAAIQGLPDTRAFMQFAWTRAEAILEASYPYTTKATGAGGTVVPADVLAEIYSAPMLAELDALGITHKVASDWAATYFH